MAQPRSTRPQQPDALAAPAEPRPLLFKTDHPRAIDQYIDYFGGGGHPLPAAEDDACGDALLERLA